MKQKFKQLLVAIVGLLLSTSAFAHDFEVDGIYYNYLDKTAKTVYVTYKGNLYNSYTNEYSGTIIIPSSVTSYSGTTYSVTSIDDNAFYDCEGLTSVTIPNSVTSIGSEAFYGCDGLTELIIEDGKETLSLGCNHYISASLGEGLFYDCPLKKIYLGRNLSYDAGMSYGYSPFYNSKLEEITISNSVTSIGDYAFRNCDGLTSVTIPNSITSIGNSAFRNCDGLTSVTIPNSVTSIGSEAFSGCSSLTSITIPNSVTSIGSEAFSGCSSLTSITIPNSVTWVGSNAFRNCKGLTSITIPNSVTSIGDEAFYGCSNIYSLTIGSGISSISSNTFSVKPKKTIWLTNTPPSGSSYASGTVNYVANEQYSSLSNVVVYPYLSSMFEVDGVKYVPVSPSERTCDAIDCSYNFSDSFINIGNTVSFKGVAMSVKDIKPYTCYGNNYINDCLINFNGNIGEYAFNGCSAIEKASINAKSIAESAFSNCSAIETITLGTELETIGNSAFYDCSKLKEVVIPNSVISLGASAFDGCSSLASATIGNAVESIEACAFSFCYSLPSIEIPKNVTYIGSYAFNYCRKLSNVIIEDRDTVLTLGSNGSSPMFSDCPLDSVYIGGDISYKTTSSYGYSPFYNNKTLRAVTITDKETEISENEFYGCANLKSVSIGDGVETIGKYAFSGCSSLESFAFGTSMKTIGEEAFSDCTALIKLSSKATTPPACGTQALDDINK